MKLNLVSDYPITDQFVDVLRNLVAHKFCGQVTGMQEIEYGEVPDGPVLKLGSPVWEGTYTQGPSVKQVLRTSGGVTKLTHAIRLVTSRSNFELLARNGYEHATLAHTGQMWLESFRNADELVVDIEVGGDIDKDVPSGDTMLMIGFYDGVQQPVVLSGDAIWKNKTLIAEIINTAKESIMHNGKFDTKWISLFCGTRVLFTFDTMLMHYAMYPGAGEHGLKDVAAHILGAPDWDAPLKDHTKGKKGYENIPADVLAYYNAQDVYYTYGIFKFMLDQADEREIQLLRKLLMPASHKLQEMEDIGIAIDEYYLTQFGEQLKIERDELLNELHTMSEGFDFRTPTEMKKKKPPAIADKKLNPSSPQQVKKYLEAQVGRKLYSTDEKNLNRLKNRGEEVEFIETLLEYRKRTKTIGTYVDGMLNRSRNGRVYSTFKLHGTITGRLSSSNPNIQNIPRDGRIRRSFVSDVERNLVLVGNDYSQAELRTMAELSSDQEMIAAFQLDAPDFFDALMPSAYPNLSAEFFDHAHPGYKELRARIKGVVYGMSYGRKAAAIAAELKMPITEAEAIISGYLTRFPDFAQWRQGIMPRVREGNLITPFGRRFQQDVITKAQEVPIENSALSFLPQSTASDICLTAAMNLHDQLVPSLDQNIVALVHDSITIECRPEHAEGILEMMDREMALAATTVFTRVPFKTEGAISTRWDEV